jgi:predicted chitinase
MQISPDSILKIISLAPMSDIYEKSLNAQTVILTLLKATAKDLSECEATDQIFHQLPKTMQTEQNRQDLLQFVQRGLNQLQSILAQNLEQTGTQQPSNEPSIKLEQFLYIAPLLPINKAKDYLPYLNAAMHEGQINTPKRQAAFLAQLAHESTQFTQLLEQPSQTSGQNFEKYEFKKNIGNTQLGDGPNFKGRGFIQLTGRDNYHRSGKALGLPLEEHPSLASEPKIAARTAVWYWNSRHLNSLADAGKIDEITKRINSASSHKDERRAYYKKALAVL